jgi:tetratricopeptide (TPR) repeat protein
MRRNGGIFVKAFRKLLRISVVFIVLLLSACSAGKYKEAQALLESGDAAQARAMFVELGDYEDSAEYINSIDYDEALRLLESGDLNGSIDMFTKLGDYRDSRTLVENINAYNIAQAALESGEYQAAIDGFAALGNFLDSEEKQTEAVYQNAVSMMDSVDVSVKEKSLEIFESLGDYKESITHTAATREWLLKEANYNTAVEGYAQGMTGGIFLNAAARFFTEYYEAFTDYGDYKDAAEKALECEQYKLFFEGRDLYRDGEYTQAIEKLEQTDVLDAEAFRGFITAVVKYKADESLESLEAVTEYAVNALRVLLYSNADDHSYLLLGLNSRVRTIIKAYSANMDIFADFIKTENNSSLRSYEIDIDDYRRAGVANKFVLLDTLKKSDTQLSLLYKSSFTRVLDDYWTAQADKGFNPAKIEVLPVTRTLQEIVNSTYRDTIYSTFRPTSKDIDLNERTETTNNRLYLHLLANEQSEEYVDIDMPNSIINLPGYDYFITNKHNARFLAYSSVSHILDAHWEYQYTGVFAGSSYHTTVRIVIKDLFTGEVLFDESQTTKVPRPFTLGNNGTYYAPARFDSSKYEPIIEKIFNDWQ